MTPEQATAAATRGRSRGEVHCGQREALLREADSQTGVRPMTPLAVMSHSAESCPTTWP